MRRSDCALNARSAALHRAGRDGVSQHRQQQHHAEQPHPLPKHDDVHLLDGTKLHAHIHPALTVQPSPAAAAKAAGFGCCGPAHGDSGSKCDTASAARRTCRGRPAPSERPAPRPGAPRPPGAASWDARPRATLRQQTSSLRSCFNHEVPSQGASVSHDMLQKRTNETLAIAAQQADCQNSGSSDSQLGSDTICWYRRSPSEAPPPSAAAAAARR